MIRSPLSAELPCRFALFALSLVFCQVPTVHAQEDDDEAEDEVGVRAFEEFVVTARKREETLQDVPAAVSAYSAEDLEVLGVTDLEDLTRLAPNVKVSAGRGTNSTINAYIRGVGQNDPLWGFEPGVGIYIDDVYIARPQGALLDVYDVSRIEILRGPQGTLYGKNTLAGAIKYVTREIDGQPVGHFSVTTGNFDRLDLKAGGSIGLNDSVFIGGSIAKFTRDGYGEVVASDDPQLFNSVGEDVSDKDVLAARANVTFLWGDDSRLKLVADTLQDDSNARGAQRLNDAFGPRLDDRYDVRNDLPVDMEEVRMTGLAATYTTTLTDVWDFKAVAATREGETETFIDFETLNTNAFNVPAFYDDEQTSLETQFNYEGGGRWRGVTGLYYFDGEACGAFDVVLGGINFTALTKGCVETTSFSLYGDASFALTERTNLNFGLRGNRDDKEADVFVAQYLGALVGSQTLFDPNNLPPGFTLLAVQTDYTNDRTFSDVSPKLGIDFQPNDDLLLYATYSHGFKSGGFDMRGNQTANPDTVDGYDSETVDNYELGAKSTLLDGTLQLNATVFYADYEDVQITTQQFVDLGGIPTNVTAVLNAGAQTNQGLELEALWLPAEQLNFIANLGFLDAEIDEFETSDPANPGMIIDVSDLNEPINAPDFTAYIAALFNQDLATGGKLTARLGYQYRDDTKVANTIMSVTDQEAYQLWDASVAYTTPNERWRFALDGQNLTDEEYRTSGYDFGPAGAGLLGGLSQLGFYGAPRTVTLSATFSF